MSTIEFRQAGPQDVGSVEALVREAYEPYIERIGMRPGPLLTDYAAAVGEGSVTVAVRGGRIVGLLITSLHPDHILVENVAVAASERGTGLGTTLLDLADTRARDAGVGEVRLYTHEKMIENLAFYPRRGFRETGRRTEHGFARVFFSRRVDGSSGRPQPMAATPADIARALVQQNSFLTLATVSAEGDPWASPLWFAARDLDLFVWASKPGAQHSLNLAANPGVSLVVFDSSAAPGEGSALYVTATATETDSSSFEAALALYNARSRDRGLPEWTPERLRNPARHRLYTATATEAFILDDHDERVRVA